MKSWFLALFTTAGCAALLTWVIRNQVIPGFLENANVEMVADWHAGLMDRYKDTGSWPDTSDPRIFSEQMYVVVGADGRRIPRGYMYGRESFYDGQTGEMMDIYNRPMKLSISGDSCQVSSSGPDGTWGTADDVSSDKVRERYVKETMARRRAQIEAAVASKKP